MPFRSKIAVGFLSLFLALLLPSLRAQPAPAVLGEVATAWPGITMQVMALQRISNGRLLVLVRIQATAKAPPSTLIGFPAVIPPNATKEERASGRFEATPFSLESSVMIDELTGTSYPALSPQAADAGHAYRPSSLVASVNAGQAAFMSVQFAAPPAPPPDALGHRAKQTVSFVLPQATQHITKIPVPAPDPE